MTLTIGSWLIPAIITAAVAWLAYREERSGVRYEVDARNISRMVAVNIAVIVWLVWSLFV